MLYKVARAVCVFVLHIVFHIKVEGIENIPQNQGYILVANHRTNFDPLLVVTRVYKQVHYMAKAELFRSAIGNWFFRQIGSFPVERGKGDTGALGWAVGVIQDGQVLGMFPEGTRSPDGKLQRAKSGAAMIAMQTGADILPCAVCFGEKLGFRSKITIRYGVLMKNQQLGFTPELNSPHEIKEASRQIMGAISNLLEDNK